MKTITCYIDFISPYAYLAFEALPERLMGISYRVIYKPVLFGAVLKYHGQLGPAEIDGKREWTYRQVLWLAHEMGVPLDMPAAHPFNPLALLRLALTCSHDGSINRYVAETVFHHVWHGGAAADDAARLPALTLKLAQQQCATPEAAKDFLKANTDEALAAGVFGVPTFAVDDKLFWGLDALPMLRAYLDGHQNLDAIWAAGAKVGVGVKR